MKFHAKGKMYPVRDLYGALAVCDEHRAEVLDFNILQWLPIKYDDLTSF